MQFQYQIFHSPGKSLYLVDILSRAPLCTGREEVDSIAEREVEDLVDANTSQYRLYTYREAQAEDPICS